MVVATGYKLFKMYQLKLKREVTWSWATVKNSHSLSSEWSNIFTVSLLVLVVGFFTLHLSSVFLYLSDIKDKNYVVSPYISSFQSFENAAVASKAPYCSEIGRDILFLPNATVADAAIATALCVGLIQPGCVGLGGGFFMVFYNATSKTSETLIARDRAPLLASQNMFNGKPEAAIKGGLSVAVPGELKGFWELWKRYGGLPWKKLFEPTIHLAENGFNISSSVARGLRWAKIDQTSAPFLAKSFTNPITNKLYQKGDFVKRPDLAATLKAIANAPEGEEDLLYRDSNLMRQFVADLKAEGGIIQKEDMLNYRTSWDAPVKMNIAGGFTIHTVPPPGSGLLLTFCLKLISSFSELTHDSMLTYHRLVESFKHAYAKRTILGDPESMDPDIAKQINELYNNLTDDDYIKIILNKIQDDSTSQDFGYYGAEYHQPDDHGTAHISIIGPTGDAIALTSTINHRFGSRLQSAQTGIVYNNQMDDFASPYQNSFYGLPPSKNNFIEPGKRPMSSIAPAIFTDWNGKVRLVVGGSGGTRIITAVAQVVIRNLWFGQNIKNAIQARRLHHQLYPMHVEYERDFDERIMEALKLVGHKTHQLDTDWESAVHGISVTSNGTIFAYSDAREDGSVAGI